MKNKIKLKINSALFYSLLCMLFFSSCHNHIDEYTIVESVQKSIFKQKYKVGLNFNYVTQYLYTDSTFAVGDTLWLIKK